MRAIQRFWIMIRTLSRARRHRSDLLRWLIRRPQLLFGTAVYEMMLTLSARVDPKLRDLAEIKAAALVNCEFCLDIGTAIATSAGVTERQLRELPKYRTSEAFSELEKLVLAFAEAMTVTPATDLAEIREQLSVYLSNPQIAELAAAVAWENQRARLNQALGVRPAGMADGMFCALPESG